MQRGGRQFLDVVHKAAIAGDRHDRLVGARHFRAERCRITVAERPLIAAVDVSARPVDREGEAADIADLCQILDIDTLIGEFGADRREVLALGAERLLETRLRLSLQLLELALARGVLVRAQRLVERSERLLCIGDDADGGARDPGDLDRV